MLHIGKNTKGYILHDYMNIPSNTYIPYTCAPAYICSLEDLRIQISKKDLSSLGFVHGDYEQLLKGKMCVVRYLTVYPVERGNVWWKNNETYYSADVLNPVEKCVLHLVDGGVLILLGITSNRNTKVVYKPN